MDILSLLYTAFLLIAFAVYRLIPKGWRKIWLFICSIVFTGVALPLQTLLMLVYGWVILFLGKLMEKAPKKRVLVSGIVLSVLVLFACKYLGFALSWFGFDRTLRFIAPLGISYIVFQCIAYLTEVYRGKLPPRKEPLDLFLYLLFFPKVLSGPIEKPDRFMAELNAPAENTFRDYLVSFSRILCGFVKKMAVANYLAYSVDRVYASLETADAFSLSIAAVLYSFQIYFDFSGYTDIAIGSAGLFGIKLTENFNRPYFATSIQNFWKRWHISLSEWLKTYIYIPLGGSRKGFFRKQLNTLLTFLVSGLWHGASWTYVLWGAFHGIMQVIENCFRKRKEKKMNSAVRAVRVFITFLLVTAAWILFRIPGIPELKVFVQSFAGHTPDISAAAGLLGLTVSAGIVVLGGVLFSELSRVFCIRKTRPALTWVIGLLGVVLIVISLCFFPGGTAESSFIYFNF